MCSYMRNYICFCICTTVLLCRFDNSDLNAVANIIVLVGFLPPFQIMKTEAQGTSCDIQDLLFKLSGTGVELTPGLNSSEDEWVLDDANPQKVNLKAQKKIRERKAWYNLSVTDVTKYCGQFH